MPAGKSPVPDVDRKELHQQDQTQQYGDQKTVGSDGGRTGYGKMLRQFFHIDGPGDIRHTAPEHDLIVAAGTVQERRIRQLRKTGHIGPEQQLIKNFSESVDVGFTGGAWPGRKIAGCPAADGFI